MSEQQPIGPGPSEPTPQGPTGAARWADYLDWLREDVIRGVVALSEEDRRTSRLPSGWTPLELLSHLQHMEQRWFVWGFLAEQVAAPWGDWNLVDDTGEVADGARWQVPERVSVDEVVQALRAIGSQTREILLAYRPETLAAVGGRFTTDPPSLEWICFHVLAEYARHAGQFDVVAELTATHPRP